MYVRISGRVRLNSHSLNTQGGGGTNYIEITKARVSLRSGEGWKIVEVPAISGNMLKHWHFVAFVDSFRRTNYANNLTSRAIRYNATRFAREEETHSKVDGTPVELEDEGKIIKEFADADVHGFLAPKKGSRRVSLVKTSFLLPTEDFIESVDERLVHAVKHNRVDVDETGKISSGKETAMMLFNREYATGVYGFSLVLDLGIVGIPQSKPWNSEENRPNLVLGEDERKARISSALKALINLLSGSMGANLSRSFPVIKLEEFIAVSGERPMPALVHGFYKDYIEESAKLLRGVADFFPFRAYHSPGIEFPIEGGEEVSSIGELVSKLLESTGGTN